MPGRHRVLLVDDSPDCQLLVRRSLEEDAKVTVAPDLKTAQRVLAQDRFDLLLLDVGLPDGSGFGFCTTVLADLGLDRPRVLFLTGRADVSDKLTGFSVGGDDYLVKPFEPLELRARVRAHLRNRAELTEAAKVIRAGNLELNLANYTVEIHSPDGTVYPELTPTEFRLLYKLARNEGRVLSREQLLSEAYEESLDISDRAVDVHMSRIRKKILGCTHSLEAIYGVGYRLKKQGGGHE